jgi:membrane protein
LARIRRALRLAWRAAGRGLVEFYRSDNLTYASSIAYYSLLSIFPFLLLVATLLGRLTVRHASLLDVVERALPSDFDFLISRTADIAQAPLELSLAGTALTLWGSMGVFAAVASAVNHAWGVENPLGFFKHKLVAFLMLLASGLLLTCALMLVAVVRTVESTWFSGVVAAYPVLLNLSNFVYRNVATPTFILVAGLIYYFVPNAKVRLRDVWFGAILAGVLWDAAFSGFSWFLGDLGRFSVHGSVAAVVAFLLWVYVSAVILLYGVEVTAAYARSRKHLPQDRPAAPVLEH